MTTKRRDSGVSGAAQEVLAGCADLQYGYLGGGQSTMAHHCHANMQTLPTNSFFNSRALECHVTARDWSGHECHECFLGPAAAGRSTCALG
jgi:hypothetical protein